LKKGRVKVLVITAVLSAIAFVLVAVGRIPVVLFLDYEPKDVIIALGGFIFGPAAAATIAVVSSLVEMFTISSTGFIGFIMNVLASCAFACNAAIIYKKKRTISGAVIGLLTGVVAMTAVMILWNYLLTPLYLHVPRADVAAMLVPTFLPFNLLKGGINAALTMLLYKPVVSALRSAKLLPPSSGHAPDKKTTLFVWLTAFAVLVGCVIVVLVWKGIL